MGANSYGDLGQKNLLPGGFNVVLIIIVIIICFIADNL